MDIIETLVARGRLVRQWDGAGWAGFGLAVQAYQKRAVPLCDWVFRAGSNAMAEGCSCGWSRARIGTPRSSSARWAATPISRSSPARSRPTCLISPAPKSCWRRAIASIPPSPPTTPIPSERSRRWQQGTRAKRVRIPAAPRHGRRHLRGARPDRRQYPDPVRIYAPVGAHKDLLAYLVRRLLENGANQLFRQPHGRCQRPGGRFGGRPGGRTCCARTAPQSGDPAAGRHLPRTPQQRRGRPCRSAGARAAARTAAQARRAPMAC